MARIASIPTLLLLGFVVPTTANAFLGQHLGAEAGLVSKRAVEQALLTELSTRASSDRIRTLEADLSSLFAAMPKNEHGNLEPSVTRYALHRYFVHKHGWHVSGLEPAGGTWNASSPSSIMKDRVPAYIQELLRERLHGQGMGQQEVAAFAAVMSDLIHKESVGILQRVFESRSVSMSSSMSRGDFDLLTDSYTVAYFHGVKSDDGGNSSILDFWAMQTELDDEFLAWGDVSEWAHDLRNTLMFEERTCRNPFVPEATFDDVEVFAQELAHRFGSFQNLECQSLKDHLMDLEFRGTGRVRLSEFYSGANDTNWFFTESVEYLRALGALDESDPSRVSVIIPNFIGSRTNCVFPSSFYSVCCMDQCESIMASLERIIQGPEAAPARIAEIISTLPSDTVEAPRNLSMPQLRRLGEIAALHAGRVPLHGRLFAQWMHHAYPRECPYPHVSGTTNPLSQDEWTALFGDSEESDEEILRHVAGRADTHDLGVAMTPEAKAEMMQWTFVEELVVSRRPAAPGMGQPLRSGLRIAVLFALVASLVRAVRPSSLSVSSPNEKLQVHLV